MNTSPLITNPTIQDIPPGSQAFPNTKQASKGGRRRSSNSKKGSGESRSANSTIVFGEFNNLEDFSELVESIKSECGPVRSIYFRQHQNCGFVYFHDQETAQVAQEKFHEVEFKGTKLRAFPPLQYFPDERDAAPRPPPEPPIPALTLIPEKDSNDSEGSSSNTSPKAPPSLLKRHSLSSLDNNTLPVTPSHMLVLKNLRFDMKQERLLEALKEIRATPDCVNFCFDHTGKFKGTAFARYPTIPASQSAYEKLRGAMIDGREIKVEYKRKIAATRSTNALLEGIDTTIFPSRPTRASLPVGGSTRGSVFSHSDNGVEQFDPNNMDMEQRAIMTELQNFIANKQATEWNFPTSMTQAQRNMVREIASYLELHHVSMGERDARYVVVSKIPFNIASHLTSEQTSHRRDRFMSHGEASSQLRSRIPAVGNTWVHQHVLREAGGIFPSVSVPVSLPAQPSSTLIPRHPLGPDGTRGFHHTSAGRGRGKMRVYHSLITPQELVTRKFNAISVGERSGSLPVPRV